MRKVARFCLMVLWVLAVTFLGCALGAAAAFYLVLLYLAWQEPGGHAGLARFAFAFMGALYGWVGGGLAGATLAVLLYERGPQWRRVRTGDPAQGLAYGAAVVLVVLAFIVFLMLLSG